LKRDAGRRARGQLLAPEALCALLREIPRLPLGLDDPAKLSRRWRPVEAEHLDRVAGPGFAELLALLVVKRAHLAPGVARDDRSPALEGAALAQHGGDRTAADVETRLDDGAGGLRVRIRLQLELGVGDEQHLLEQLVESRLLLGRAPRHLRVPAP